MRQWERWVEEAEEVSSPVEEAEQFTVFSVEEAVREEGLLWAMYCSEWAYYQEWRESHPLVEG